MIIFRIASKSLKNNLIDRNTCDSSKAQQQQEQTLLLQRLLGRHDSLEAQIVVLQVQHQIGQIELAGWQDSQFSVPVAML